MVNYDINSFDVSLKNIKIESGSLIPRVLFEVRVVLLKSSENPEISLSNILAEVYIMGEKETGNRYIGTAIATHPYILINEEQITLYLDLEYYKLEQIEKIRQGGDFKLFLTIRGLATAIIPRDGRMNDVKNFHFSPQQLRHEFPKSTWAEKFLKEFNFKHVRLFEFPEIMPPESLNEAMKHLDDGWVQFSSGHYNNVLVDCRKALEEVSTIVMKAGFKKMDKNGKGEDIEVPDWQKIFESGTLSDSYKNIFKKLMGFAAPGAHTGKSINNEDALFALMITHALIYYLVEKFPP